MLITFFSHISKTFYANYIEMSRYLKIERKLPCKDELIRDNETRTPQTLNSLMTFNESQVNLAIAE